MVMLTWRVKTGIKTDHRVSLKMYKPNETFLFGLSSTIITFWIRASNNFSIFGDQ